MKDKVVKTSHKIHLTDARELTELDENSIDLVVTSPPYPMIEMWDELFESFDDTITTDIKNGNDWDAYEKMHSVLNTIWKEIPRVVSENGIVCINIGDATRTINGKFTRYPNHETISKQLRSHGLEPLTSILWRKPTNSPAKYMGSGMRPPNAYVTLEHEHILIFRNGSTTRTIQDKSDRNESAYFMEERNEWFSDLWTNVNGVKQTIEQNEDDMRSRSAAYPVDIPHRLINMYSVYGDTVLDPFWGTGTTTYASLLNARNSIGYELNPDFITSFEKRLENLSRISEAFVHSRLLNHKHHVENNASYDLEYTLKNYNIPVVRKQQKEMVFYTITSTKSSHIQDTAKYIASHKQYSSWNNSELPINISTTNHSLTDY